MDKIILENFRCFHSRHEIPLAPLTLLVGENSTGKTSFLAAVRTAFDLAYGTQIPDFNEEPFDLGSYDQVAYCRSERAGSTREFSVGCELMDPGYDRTGNGPKSVPHDSSRPSNPRSVRFVSFFSERTGQPLYKKYQVSVGESVAEVGRKLVDGDPCIYVNVRSRKGERSLRGFPKRIGPEWGLHAISVLPAIWPHLLREWDRLSGRGVINRKEWDLLDRVGRKAFGFHLRRPLAFAPLRTRPERTYNPKSEARAPEGTHVPMVLARMASTDRPQWTNLKERLTQFGGSSGLFKGIEVRRKGRKITDPFQILLRVAGPASNLIDVGYGVSQVLPILVDCLLAEKGQMILMQQPEVHLHPRAQAELGSFLGYLVKKEKKQFVIETHSDYLLDRVRMDIRDGKGGLSPKDVRILYFERRGADVDVHPIEIDTGGNIVGAPPTYRRFFLDEVKRSIGG